jgi:hypothetical protein
MDSRRRHGPWGLLVLVAAAFAAAGCGSGGVRPNDPSHAALPPYPADADPCAAYCLVWVPPVYRDVPKLCPCPGHTVKETIPEQKVVFEEVCKPGCYETREIPDRCRHSAIVQVSPSREEWLPVSCPGGCPCEPGQGNCWKRVVLPPEYKVCETTQTEKGVQYCAFTPPEREVVAKTVRCDVTHTRYVPADYSVTYVKELVTAGHYEWQVRYDCAEPMLPPIKKVCVPKTGCGCVPCGSCAK